MSGRPYRVAGRRLSRLDGVAKVTGSHVYTVDFALPGMLFGKVLRGTTPHARLRGIDLDAARAAPGVRAVIAAADIPAVRFGQVIKDTTVFATERVRFVGQPIAAVAADTPEAAEHAARLIEVALEPLPAIFDPEEALGCDAALLHPEWESYKGLPIIARSGNVASRARMRTGDAKAAFARAHRVYEHRFRTALVHPGYTEPRAAVADWDEGGTVTVWSNTQLPFDMQNTLAEILDLPAGQVRVIVPGIGGGFGGKLRVGVEHIAALLARAAGKPVRIATTSQEELTAAYPRQATIIDLKTAFDRDGRLMARAGRVLVDCGAFANSGPGTAAISMQVLVGPYRTPNLDLESLSVYTNKVPAGSFRAPAGPMANFAVESQMDIAADDLGIDPLDLRLRNVVREGDLGPSGERLTAVSIEECLRRAAAAIGWDERRPAPGRAKGLACSWWMTTGGTSEVEVTLHEDGTATLISGAVEIGTGALTGAAQVLAEELSLDLADISVAPVDTGAAPFDYGAQGSRTAFSVGNACRAAASELRVALFSAAARKLGCSPEGMSLLGKTVMAGSARLSIADLLGEAGGSLTAKGTALAPVPAYDPSRVENHPLPAWNTPSYHAHAVDLSVDSGTGEVTIHRYVVAQDVGFALNPTYIEGQIEGGVSQGIGQALSEEIVYRDGQVLNANLTDYKMPTALDMPNIESLIIECASEAGPFGAKGVGEPPCIEPPAAIANAVAAATGHRIASLPITAEKILSERARCGRATENVR
ncbi:MAG: xanthine dehydrogenase family protein molybdopterin-binding subunit [Alphaproteobacteria bacterium]|nr:xanthine dehydrogenase family protein molybdopterin-binding subunit [Alphaproteobacteria bacterium]